MIVKILLWPEKAPTCLVTTILRNSVFSYSNKKSDFKPKYNWTYCVVFRADNQWSRFLILIPNITKKKSKELQSTKMDLSAASRLLNCTKNELQYLRDDYQQSVLDTASFLIVAGGVRMTMKVQRTISKSTFFTTL